MESLLTASALALSTLVQEDAPTIGAALLSSAGKLDWRIGFTACFAGIWVGDALLYLIARGFGRPLLATRFCRRFVSTESLQRGEEWFARRGLFALVASRFVPGLRLPTYLAAGLLRVSLPRFLLITAAAVFVWTGALFLAAHWLGERAMALAHNRGAALALGALALIAILIWRYRRTAWIARWTHWEFWPAWLFYTPVVLHYLWLTLRYRGFTLPTAANPGIFSGGIVGESKFATLDELHKNSPEFTAEAHLVALEAVEVRVEFVSELLRDGHFKFPFVLKPDVGQRGIGVKLVRDWSQAESYLRSTSAPLVAQRYVPGPHEVGVFYYRFPHESRGRIFAITEKIFPVITGDGVRTVEQLIRADKRARLIAEKYLIRLGDRRDEVLAAGATLKLVEAGNHAQGCIFQDGMHLWSEELERRIDQISQKLNGFFIGRYDIRYSSESELRSGRHFRIIELNGAASEATSIYDARNSLWSAYGTLFSQWRLVFAIGAANRRHGAAPTALPLLWRTWRNTVALTATYPAAD
jgi:membrane protein DedA with SNARE-associated domain